MMPTTNLVYNSGWFDSNLRKMGLEAQSSFIPFVGLFNGVLMKLSNLFEMPQLIGEVDFDLDDRERNRIVCNSLRPSAVELFTFRNVVIKKSGKHIYAERGDGLMPYLIETERKWIGAVNKQAMIQRGLWRDAAISSIAGLTKKVFFEVLLPQTGMVASDRQQSDDGRRFWVLRVSEALEMGLFVYLVDVMGPKELTRIKSHEQFDGMQSEIWGTDPKFKTKLLLISRDELVPSDNVKLKE